jgi:hypothetical protein
VFRSDRCHITAGAQSHQSDNTLRNLDPVIHGPYQGPSKRLPIQELSGYGLSFSQT